MSNRLKHKDPLYLDMGQLPVHVGAKQCKQL